MSAAQQPVAPHGPMQFVRRVCTIGEWREATQYIADDGVLIVNTATGVLMAVGADDWAAMQRDGPSALLPVVRANFFGDGV